MSSSSPELDRKQAQLLMSQLIDGELSPADANRLNRYLASSPEAIDWMEGLDLAREAAKDQNESSDHSVAISSIQSLIESEAEAPPRESKSKLVRFPAFVRPLAAAAAVALVGALAWIGLNSGASVTAPAPNVVEFVATDIPDASTFVYSDEESGWTVVWVEAMEPLPEERG